MQSGGAELNLGCPHGRRGGAAPAPAWWSLSAPGVTVDQLDAAERCETLLQDTLDALRPVPVWQDAVPRSGSRLPLPGRGSEVLWYVTLGRDLLTVVSQARRAELVGAVERHWRRSGWTITSVNACRDRLGVAAGTPDGYRLVLNVGEFGEIGLVADSPGVARSERLGRSCEEGGIGPASLPYVHCPYWSALI
ncbi:hypothetical protein [Streptomyces sp. FH025]|uniref:hypothetical protein n=1 Tax=Streptomyces sp. FH025 TaxID=2815937 RepID=UPI001A9E38B2|nr:hypothetical protein [Streptomyces sp. FH025]MBO1416740.1 hypothetical protein [Streptomyces sp. FH025]